MAATHPFASEAIALLEGVADRSTTGQIEDPAALAAVVGIERIAAQAGTTDAADLVALVTAPPPPLVEIVDDVVERVSNALVGRDAFGSRDGTLVNAEAGVYPVATDAEVLRAGVRAAHRTFVDHPYYAIRYGARGGRWAASDSSWIGHLLPAAPPVAIRQISWLAGFLARKGMPTWLMERHLAALATELETAGIAAGPLPQAAAHLRDVRSAHADDEALERAQRAVEETVRTPPAPDAGRLLAAGVADVLSGAAADDLLLVEWFTDPVRTDPADADALLAVRDEVRAAAAQVQR